MRTSAPYYFNLVWHASLKIASKLDTPFSLPPLLNWNIDKYMMMFTNFNAISSKNKLSKSLRGQGKFLHNLSCS